MKPLISILMPVYNGDAFVSKAVTSILEQTCKDFELIAVDDASSDNSLQILEDLAQKNPAVFQNIKTCPVSA